VDGTETTVIEQKEELGQIAQRLKLGNLEEALYFPKYFQVETIRLCNARCPFCSVDQWDKSHPFMADALYDKIVAEMSEYADWIEFVAVQRAGEPLLDQKIVSRIAKLKRAGIRRVSLSTNASKLDDAMARALLQSGLDEIMFSIDSIDEESYRRMRVGLPYEEVVANIRNFFRVRQECRPDCIVRVRGVSFYDLSREEHRQELKRWEAFWAPLTGPQDRIYMKRAHNWGNQKEWKGHIPENQEWVYHPCVLPWSTMHISAMGIVALCPQDYDAKMNLGDINASSMAEVWRNAKWQAIRRQHASGRRNEISFCQGCRLFDLDNSLENKV